MSYPTFHTDDQGILVANQALDDARALLYTSDALDDRDYALQFQFQNLETTLREITDTRFARSLSGDTVVPLIGNENVQTLNFIVATVQQMLESLTDDDNELPGQLLSLDIPGHPPNSPTTTVDHAITQTSWMALKADPRFRLNVTASRADGISSHVTILAPVPSSSVPNPFLDYNEDEDEELQTVPYERLPSR